MFGNDARKVVRGIELDAVHFFDDVFRLNAGL